MHSIENFPPYTLRKSNRARYLRLRITTHGELELVVPQRVSKCAALEYLNDSRDWIDARLHLLNTKSEFEWPAEISLPAIECNWETSFRYDAKKNRLKETFDQLQIYLCEQDLNNFQIVMKRWLLAKAKLELKPWLIRLSRQTQLKFSTVHFRGQKTVWGTCTEDARIGLNYKLLFLPPEYVEYVLIHELAHTVHLDHSKAFWALVAGFLPQWRELRYEVRRAESLLPNWI